MLAKSIIATALLSFVASASEIALYWGQAGANTQQESLASYCSKGDADIFILSFMDTFSSADAQMDINFSNACGGTRANNGLMECTQIGEDIKTCQKLGKKIFLSLGGASGSYGFSSDSVAEGFAETLWDYFGAGTGKSTSERPFGDAVVDGFDFDIEGGGATGYAALATKLRDYYAQDSSKTYYISAAPQCPYPDSYVGDLLSKAKVDYAFVQFYNNYCSVDGTFNWDTWADFAKSAPNDQIKIFLGLPGSSASAGSGYIDTDTIKSTINGAIAANNANFGGVMLWDASSSYANGNFVSDLRGVLDGSSSGSSDSSSASASSDSASAVTAESYSSAEQSEVSSAAESTEAPAYSSVSSTEATEATSYSAPAVSSTGVETSSNPESPAPASTSVAYTADSSTNCYSIHSIYPS
ncbi:unnamed protein product [Ambrosiozyma monospora]|uniref:Unnamed protein product n=1 Tax=Ambrosiozyma monospora TaxID=43982 RepID=A0ACB5SWB2_AMBMO|nr:unnamed protein product [Ambrosiozyma monospora]